MKSNPPKIAILMACFNGEEFLSEQLDSIANQSYHSWQVWASDDGSTDKTLTILKKYQEQWGIEKLVIVEGPQKGSASNFMSLIFNNEIIADYFAFADQDDIWLNDKLETAIKKLHSLEDDRVSLYFGRTTYIDKANREIALSPHFTKPFTFRNALVQCAGGGNTMIFNSKLRSFLKNQCFDMKILHHDWWLYLVVTGLEGVVFYDSTPFVRYRQHEQNQMGLNISLKSKWRRIKALFQNSYKVWNDENVRALNQIKNHLTSNNQKIFEDFKKNRQRSVIPRLFGIIKIGLYRQTFLGHCGLLAVALLNKL
jgi:glycosyltransferase involved in cell wall biosynthesis